MLKFLKRAFLAAGLGLSSAPAVAADDAAPPTIRGAQENLTRLSSVRDHMLRLANDRDIIILSAEDILTPLQVLRARITGAHMERPSSVITDRERAVENLRQALEKYGRGILPDNMVDDETEENLTDYLQKIAGGQASSSPIDTFRTCIINTPHRNETAQVALAGIAGLPASMSSFLATDLRAEAIYMLTMLHEAAHCDQTHIDTDDDVQASIEYLQRELDADNKAFAAFRQIYASDPEFAERSITMFQHARAIANVRNGGNITEGATSYLTHGLSPHVEINGVLQSYTPADVILAAGQIGALNDVIAGQFLTTLSDLENHDEAFAKYAESKGETYYSFNLRGQVTNQNYPLIQYAGIRIIRDIIRGLPQNTVSPQNHLVHSMMDRYLTAFETLVPSAANNPVVLDYIALVKPVMQGAIAKMDGSLSSVEETIPPANNPALTSNSYIGREYGRCAAIHSSHFPGSSEGTLRYAHAVRVCLREAKENVRTQMDRELPPVEQAIGGRPEPKNTP